MIQKFLARLTKTGPKASPARKPKMLSFEGLENRIMFDVCLAATPRVEFMPAAAMAQLAKMPQVESERVCTGQVQPIPLPHLDSVFAMFSVAILDVAGQVNMAAPRIQKPATDGLMA